MRPTPKSACDEGGDSGDSAGLSARAAAVDHLPIFLNLRNQATVVVGGGSVAARKVELLRRTGAHVTIVAPELGAALRELSDRREVRHVAAAFHPSHLDGATIVISATGVPEVNQAVASA